ncbi:MAG: aldo/keto reductase [bacterium]
MEYRSLGRTNLKVSEVGFGAWAIGGGVVLGGKGVGYGPTDDAVSLKAIQRAVDLGVNFFDTADAYGAGHSEELLGRALHDRWGEVYVATKVGNQRRDPLPSVKNFSRDYVMRAAEASLKRLRKDVIDVYQLHNPTEGVYREGEIFDTLQRLKDAGKIRYWGVSITTPGEGVELIDADRVDTLQVRYSILEREPERELFPLAKRKDIGIIVRVPLYSGVLTGKFTEETTFPPSDHRSSWLVGDTLKEMVAKANALRFLVKGKVKTLAEAALRFVLCNDAVSVVIPGIKTSEQAEANCAASDGHLLTKEDLAEIDRLCAANFGIGNHK